MTMTMSTRLVSLILVAITVLVFVISARQSGEFKLVNSATEPLSVVFVTICNQLFRFENVPPGQRLSPRSDVLKCEGGYTVDVRFKSGRRVQRAISYVTSKMDVKDEIVITDRAIDVQRTGAGAQSLFPW